MPIDDAEARHAVASSLRAIGRAYADAVEVGTPDPVVIVESLPHRLAVRSATRWIEAARLERLAVGAGRSIMAWPEDRPLTVLVETPSGLRVHHLALDDGVPGWG